MLSISSVDMVSGYSLYRRGAVFAELKKLRLSNFGGAEGNPGKKAYSRRIQAWEKFRLNRYFQRGAGDARHAKRRVSFGWTRIFAVFVVTVEKIRQTRSCLPDYDGTAPTTADAPAALWQRGRRHRITVALGARRDRVLDAGCGSAA